MIFDKQKYCVYWQILPIFIGTALQASIYAASRGMIFSRGSLVHFITRNLTHKLRAKETWKFVGERDEVYQYLACP